MITGWIRKYITFYLIKPTVKHEQMRTVVLMKMNMIQNDVDTTINNFNFVFTL